MQKHVKVVNHSIHYCQGFKRKIDIHLPFKDVHQHHLNIRHITQIPSNPIKPPFSRWYNPNMKCDDHDEIFGHSNKIVRILSIKSGS
jgi:hypothetical protein